MSVFVVVSAAVVAAGIHRSSSAAPPKRRGGNIRVEKTARFQEQPALSFEGGTAWINTGPIRLEELRGKVVLLDFWTFCCINCHHVLPDLAKLEQKYKNELVVIGVHSPKFFGERDTENIRQKVHEYQIKHPVVNDADQVIWNRFQVRSWPTIVLIDPQGHYYGSASGEGNYEALDHHIGLLVAKHKEKGDLNLTPLTFYPESDKPDETPLSYPGKVVADAKGKRLFIADTAHNRLVMTDLDGAGAVTIGNGVAGLVDGDYAKAQFHRPQGMCLIDDLLYVADTENHALRVVDLKAKTVETLAGNGQQSHRRSGTGAGKSTGLNSPWDLVLIPGTNALAIAMAGPHQIWRYDIATKVIEVWAGTSEENLRDGPIKQALFAQPSGLATDGHHLFVADSEVSALRSIELGKKPYVHTIVGLGLFEFDDRDGVGEDVRLQHCLGVAYGNGKLYVADTYNNKIKVCNPEARSVETLIGNVMPGKTDNPPRFYQPGGLSVSGTKLYVADTNNQAIRVVDLNSNTVKTLELQGLKPPTPPRRAPRFPNPVVKDLPAVKVKPSAQVAFHVEVPVETGYKLNEEVPMPYLFEAPKQQGLLAEGEASGHRQEKPSKSLDIKVALAKTPAPGESVSIKLSVGSFVCSENSSLCRVKNFVWNVPITFDSGGTDVVKIAPEATKQVSR